MSVPSDFTRPGHVIPVRMADGGAAAHPGAPEASVELAILADAGRAAVFAAVPSVANPVELATADELAALARDWRLDLVAVSAVAEYCREYFPEVRRTGTSSIQVGDETLRVVRYEELGSAREHVTVIAGRPELESDPFIAVHTQCLLGDVFAAVECACGEHLRGALRQLVDRGSGVLLYLRDSEVDPVAHSCHLGAPLQLSTTAAPLRPVARQVLADLAIGSTGPPTAAPADELPVSC